jgi:hypothetical protein
MSLIFGTTGGNAQEGTAQSKAQASALKRLSDGQPDIQGTYISGWSVPYERYTEAERKAYDDRMIAVRGPNPGAYGTEWTEGQPA